MTANPWIRGSVFNRKQSTHIIAILAKLTTHQQHLGHLSSWNGHRAGMVKSLPRVQEIADVI